MDEASLPAVDVGAAARAWLVPCSDFAGRRRVVIVLAAPGQVVMVAPPAEVAILTAGEVEALCAALIEAKAESVRAERAG
jgi:hypothetical protein